MYSYFSFSLIVIRQVSNKQFYICRDALWFLLEPNDIH
jgi:hypothetical protein